MDRECEECVSVLIVGAGPTGLTAANLLGLYGIDTLLIERNTELNGFPRAISIDDEGLRICQALGLHKEILPHVLQDLGAQYVSRGQLLVRVAPRNQRNGYPLISTFDQPGLEAALLAGLQRFSCIEIRFGYTLEAFVQTEQGVQASVRTASGLLRQIACNYLLACDGGKSFVRNALGIPMRGTTFPQRWLVADGICEDDTATNCITFFCDPTRPSVSIPAPGQRRRWEFMLHPGEPEDQFLALTNLHQLIQRVGGPCNPQITRQTIYTFHAAYAASFAYKRIFLLGDAAHLLPPFGGQGMNCGLRDANNLVWKLALVLRGQVGPDILKTYQQERAPHVSRMIRFSSFLGRMIMTTSYPLAFLRDIAIRALVTLPSIASSLADVRIKPEPVYKHGLLLSDGSKLSRALTGQLLPQPTVLIWGEKPVLLDELLGYGFALLRLYPDPGEAFKPLRSDFWQRLKPRYICIVPAMEDMQDTFQNITCVLDSHGQIARFVRGHHDFFLLVRPDRYVLGAFHIDRERAFVERLQKHLFRSEGQKFC